MKRVLKWDVPVDDKPHPIGAGPVLHVACQSSPYVVQVWTEEEVPDALSAEPTRYVVAQVYGTGHTYPGNGFAVGTAFAGSTGLVWHLVTFPGVVQVPTGEFDG